MFCFGLIVRVCSFCCWCLVVDVVEFCYDCAFIWCVCCLVVGV